MSDASICPKCSYPREGGALDCPACGIVYDRYNPDRRPPMRSSMSTDPYARVEPQAASGPPPPPPASGAAPAGMAAGAPPEPMASQAAGSLYAGGGGGDLYGGMTPAGAAAGADDGLYNPYAAPAVQVSRPSWVQNQPLARRFTRLAAVLLDGLIFFVAFLPFIVRVIAADTPEEIEAAVEFSLGFMVLAYLGLVVANFVLLYRNGQTLGKKALGIKIVRTDGDRAGLARIFFLRMLVVSFLSAIPVLGLVFALADPLFIFGQEQRCIHDYIADTKVVEA